MTSAPSPSSVIHDEQALARRAYPANVTFNDLIRANKRKSIVLVMLMSALLVALGGALAAAAVAWGGGDARALLPSVVLGAIAAAVIAVIASLWSFYGGSKAILSISGARELPPHEDPQLHNVIEELCIAAGMPKPKVYLIEDDALNAFATGRDPEHAAVAITAGLRRALNRDELAAVMAHELSHVRHYDIRFAMLMATMVGLIVFAADAFRRMIWYGGMGGGRRGGSRGGGGGKGGNPIMLIILIVALILSIIAPLLAMLIRFAVSRQREYLADAGAVELTRYPQGMISALAKLGTSREPLKRGNRATAHLYIVNPLKDAMRGEGHELNSAFRTHPPLHDRIKRLQALIQ